MKRQIFIMLVIVGVSCAANGQQPQNSGSPCPPGMIPGEGGCFSPTDESRLGSGAQTPTYRGPLWQDRFGAIANSPTSTAGGVAQNMKSARAARKKALSDCGARDCEVRIEGRNSCLATAWGGGMSSFAAKPTQQEAEIAVMDDCRKNKTGAVCTLDYSACSLPVRIR